MSFSCAQGQQPSGVVDQSTDRDQICESPGGSGGSSTGDGSTNDSLSGFKTAFPMEIASAGLPPTKPDQTGKVHAASPPTSRPISGECPPESTRPKQRLYPALPVEDDPPVAHIQEQGPLASTASSPAPLKTAVSQKGPPISNPKSTVAEVSEADPVDPQEHLPSKAKETRGHVPYSPDLPRVQTPSSLDKMPAPSAPPMPLPLSRPARDAGLQHKADSSPLSPMSYALNEIKSGNRDPSAIRRGLAAMGSTPMGGHSSSQSPASSTHSGKRRRPPSPSPPPVSRGLGATSPKKACTPTGSPHKTPSPAAAAGSRMNTPAIGRGQSSEKKSGWLAKLFKS